MSGIDCTFPVVQMDCFVMGGRGCHPCSVFGIEIFNQLIIFICSCVQCFEIFPDGLFYEVF